MHDEQPAVVAGIYTQPYNEIVRPERVWKISKYFLRRWTPYLSPSEVWLVIGARQLSYFNERRPWFRAYDRTLAEAAGLHVKVFRRTIKKAIAEGEGAISAFLRKTADPHYTREDGVTRQTQTRYTIRLDDPLTPGDATALAYWLRRNSPVRVTATSIKALLEEAMELPLRALRAEEAAPVAAEAPDLLAVVDVVHHVFAASEDDGIWREAADALHTHIVAPELAHFETQYFRRQWLPQLGPGPALLLSYLRSLCYHNDDSGEIRDEIALESGHLEEVFQVSSRTLRRWFTRLDEFASEDPADGGFAEAGVWVQAGAWVQALDAVKQSNQKVLTTYRVNLRTPLTAADLQTYRQRLAANGQAAGAAAEKRVTDEKFPTLSRQANGGSGQEVLHTAKGEGQEGAHRSAGGGQIVPDSEGGDGQKVAGWATEEGSYKYYKILLETAGLKTFEDMQEKVPQQEQQAWLWVNGRARASFAAVVADDATGCFLERIGVQEPARTEILAQRVGLTEAVGWMLYALRQENLERPVSYVITRLCRGDPPPLDFVQLASLSWEQWRTYAWAWQARSLPEGIIERLVQLPLFQQWGEVYGALPSEELPFEVGVGLSELEAFREMSVGGVETKQDAMPQRLPVEEAAVWQVVLEELALQMTRATYDAWLREARLVACDGDTYVVAVASAEARAWLENRLQETVERTVGGVTDGRVRRVHFVVEQ